MPAHTPPQKSIAVLWNPSAGGASQAEQLLPRIAATPGVEVCESSSREDAMTAVHRAIAAGATRIVAAGGDGTVNAVATALAGEQNSDRSGRLELAILPVGTGNDLARTLGMPLDPNEAWDLCINDPAIPLDLLEIEMPGVQPTVRIAANMVTAGNTGKYLTILTDEMKKRWGPFCYLRGAVDLLEDLEPFPLLIAIDDRPAIPIDALNVFFANGKTSGGGMVVSPDASINDGQLDLLVIRDGTAFDLATLTVDYLTADLRRNDLVVHERCRRVEVTCTKLIPLSTDGDAAASARFTVTVKPGALHAVQGRS